MKILARFVLSLEKLLKDPIGWSNNQPWLLRVALVVLIIPFISIVSITSYKNIYLNEKNINSNISEQSTQEIIQLRKDLERFHNSQIEELAYLSEDIAKLKKSKNSDSDVLGVNDEQVTQNLKMRIENIDLSKADKDLVYIKTDISGARAFIEPSSSSQKLETLELGSFYPSLLEKEDWQQIDLGDGNLGWVENKFIIKFPLDEKN